MVKKNERQAIRPDTCSKCKRGKPVKVSMGNPKWFYVVFSTGVSLPTANETVIMRFDYERANELFPPRQQRQELRQADTLTNEA